MSLFDIVVTISLILWIVVCGATLVLLFSAFPLLRRLAVRMDKMDRVASLLETRVEPILERADRVADDTRYITSVLRADIETVSRSVGRAADAVDRMVEMARERATELNGLLRVVQEETEETFLSTASILRAVRGLGRRASLTRAERSRRRLG